MTSVQKPPELEFNQTESITARLRDLVRNYPKGLGLVKEFLQNADDAGAGKLTIVYDRRRHNPSGLPPAMQVALDPALLFINDQIFTEEDFLRIQQIGEGGKIRDAARTGRFGQGFNTCYSITDHPSLLTGDRIAWFDPHHRAFDSRKNAYAWKLSHVEQVWPGWINTFCPAGWTLGKDSFPGTVFRLPLRTTEDASRSEIIQEAFSDNDFDEILCELRQVGAAILVFLRSVSSLEVREIDAYGLERLRYRISTSNELEVESQRAILRHAVVGSPKDLINSWLRDPQHVLPVVQFDHSFHVSDVDGSEREEQWAVTNGLFRGPGDQLLHAALDVWNHQEKAVPWAGAAVQRGVIERETRSGGLACFLPLPEMVSWPVWLHGWFDLSSNRRGITRSADVGDTTTARYLWNRSLMEYAVGVAWAMLIQQTRGSATTDLAPYAQWPELSDKSDELDEALLSGFYREAATRPIIKANSAGGSHWSCLADVWSLPIEWHPRLLAPFMAEGWAMCDPAMSKAVLRGFQHSKQEVRFFTSGILCAYLRQNESSRDVACKLKDAPKTLLTRSDWVLALTEFCAEEKLSALKFLPLAVLSDGLLHTYTACGPVYLVNSQERMLLEALSAHLFDETYQDAIGFEETVEAIGVVKMDLANLLEGVKAVISLGTPAQKWITSLFEYLELQSVGEVQNNSQKLKDLALIPDQFNQWHEMGLLDSPLIAGDIAKPLRNALTKIRVPLLHGSEQLARAIETFSSKHNGFLWRLTPSDLADILCDHAESPWIDENGLNDRSVLNALLNYLASSDWLSDTDPRRANLQRVRILPTLGGERVTAQSASVYVPSGFSPPNGAENSYRILDTGKSGKWQVFFEQLGVPRLDAVTFVETVLLPGIATADQSMQLRYLVWLRDEFKVVERDMTERQRKDLREKIRNTSILPIKGGGLAPPFEVYHPEAKAVSDLLGKEIRIPDSAFFSSQHDLWGHFFNELDLPKRPLAKDILAAIHRAIQKSSESGTEMVRTNIRSLLKHLGEYWTRLADVIVAGDQTLANALAQIAWLPAAKSNSYAAAQQWPDRLWRANELVPARLANLAASKYPVLDGLEFSEQMAKALKLVTNIDPTVVLEHFSRIRALPSPNGSEKEAIIRAVTEIYRYLGRLTPEVRNQWKIQIDAASEEACILVNGIWWSPHCCFFEPLPFSTNRMASLAKSKLGTDDHQVRVGLEILGVSRTIENIDWVLMLEDIAVEFEGGQLSPEALNEARQAIRRLRLAPQEFLVQNDVLVPLSDGRLERAQLSIIPDDPRLRRMSCATPLPLIEDNEDAIDVGRKAHAKSLRNLLNDRLSAVPEPSQKTNHIEFARQMEEKVRSSQFYECLQRIALDEAISRSESDPVSWTTREDLSKARSLRIRVTPAIHVESVADINGEEMLAFSVDDAASFLDNRGSILWIKERPRLKMADEVVRTICDLCDLKAELRVSRVLEVAPEQMAGLLDDEDLAPLDFGSKLELTEWNESELGFETGDNTELDSDIEVELSADAVDWGSETAPENGSDGADFSPTNSDIVCASDTSREADAKCSTHAPDAEFAAEKAQDLKRNDAKEMDQVGGPARSSAPHPEPEEVNSTSDSISATRVSDNSLSSKSTIDSSLRMAATAAESSISNSDEPRASGPRINSENGKAIPPAESDGRYADTGRLPRPPAKAGQEKNKQPRETGHRDLSTAKQVRLTSYVHEQPQTDYDTETGEDNERALEIGNAGEKIVAQFEAARGRIVCPMPKNHKGYDLESRGPDGCIYIEVKGIDGTWGTRGVPVSRAQCEKALEYGESWWLYVVENAMDTQLANVLAIPNPFLRATEYRFDSGWRWLAANAKSNPLDAFIEGARGVFGTWGHGTIRKRNVAENGSISLIVNVDGVGERLITPRVANGLMRIFMAGEES